MILVINNDNLVTLRTYPDNHFSSVLTDPQYGLAFMGMHWDYDLPSVELWEEVLRVLKPGGHLLAFGGTRTYHRLVVNIEDAGFEIRDQLQWIYGQGFPKNRDLKKNDHLDNWDGWGTALKPANEPICLARKPLEKGLTIAQNVQKWGTGAININASRISLKGKKPPSGSAKRVFKNNLFNEEAEYGDNKVTPEAGRFPSNVILDEEAAAILDEQTGVLTSGKPSGLKTGNNNKVFGQYAGGIPVTGFGDSGGASRFFYCAKASSDERNKGLEGFEKKQTGMISNTSGQHLTRRDGGAPEPKENNHPTVKPISLMRYLARLITPPGGILLDLYAGSGSTGCACALEGFDAVLIEKEADYSEIAKARIKYYETGQPS